MSELVRVLALDPGEKVGWARGEVDPQDPAKRPRRLRHGITPLKDMALAVAQQAGDYDVVVYETFRLTPLGAKVMIGSDLPTAQFVGMVRLAAWLAPGVTVRAQGPAIKSTAVKSAPVWLKTKLARMPAAHDDAHDGDALMHLWFYIWKTYVGGSNAR